MVLLGDKAQMEAHFGPFGDSVSFSARLVHGLRQMYHSLKILLDALDGAPRSRGSNGSSL
jgi:hypothetical protein